MPKKSIKVNDKYVDKIDIGNPYIGTDISYIGGKWDLMLIILVQGPTNNILKTLQNKFLLLLLVFYQ